MYDMKIAGGTIVDGTGADRFQGDVALKDGVIVAVKRGGRLGGEAAEVVDATGKIVTPGFVDIHTHYDGQITWDTLIEPSSQHGVTTIVTGNCGVGFAPVRRGHEGGLITLMAGVEDIPSASLEAGMTWGWESFPEYLDSLEQRQLSLDVGTQIGHGPVRSFVMGDRGTANEDSTAEDVAAMARLVAEATEAGSLGFTTSRALSHKGTDGKLVPGTFATDDELFGIIGGMRAGGGGVFEVVGDLDSVRQISVEFGIPVTFVARPVPGWREVMDGALAGFEEGAQLVPQHTIRPLGVLVGWGSNHPFGDRPTFRQLAGMGLPFPDLIAELSKPGVRDAILTEENLPPRADALYPDLPQRLANGLDVTFVIGDVPDYEPSLEDSVANLGGPDPLPFLYDHMLEGNGTRFCLRMPGYTGNLDGFYDLLMHPAGVVGLSDGGAHCGILCDASAPTAMLTHWSRDRRRGPKLTLEHAVRLQTQDTARLYGLGDRGVLAEGKKADVNVIDYENLTLHHPRPVWDLPASGRRLLQDATGYEITVVSGVVTRRQGKDTGERPGRLVRGPTLAR